MDFKPEKLLKYQQLSLFFGKGKKHSLYIVTKAKTPLKYAKAMKELKDFIQGWITKWQ